MLRAWVGTFNLTGLFHFLPTLVIIFSWATTIVGLDRWNCPLGLTLYLEYLTRAYVNGHLDRTLLAHLDMPTLALM